MSRRQMRAALRAFRRGDAGAIGPSAVIWTIGILAVFGVALDVANAHRARAMLQVTADASALAAAMSPEDPEEARAAALSLARRNMPPQAWGQVLGDDAVTFGSLDADTGTFAAGAEPANAVRVRAVMNDAQGNPLRTWLLRFAGVETLGVAAEAVAMTRPGGGGGAPEPGPTECASAVIKTTANLGIGGNNSFSNGVCLHGETGVHAGGNDFFEEDVRVSAADIDSIYIGHVRHGSARREDVAEERSLSAPIVDGLQSRFDWLWANIWPGNAQTYSGYDLPDFVFDENGTARIVRVNQGWWTMQRHDVQPHTIYLVNHGMQIAGNVDLQNVAILARGQIGVGGGNNLNYRDVVLFGLGQLNLAGNITWGDPDFWCEAGRFSTYLFSMQSVSLGGWGPKAGMFGVIAAAPSVSTGGSLKSAGGLHIESTSQMQLGGNSSVIGCGAPLEAEMDLDLGREPAGGGEPRPAGARLVR